MIRKFLFTTLLCASANYMAAQTVMFRGDNHCGIFPEKGLLKQWPAEGPQKKWVINDLGKGNTSAIVAGEFIYTTGLTEDEQQEHLSCHRLDGSLVYQSVYGQAWTKSYQESRCSPLVDGDRVYVISGMGEVVCLNRADGKKLWSFEYWKRYGLTPNDQGICEQPLILGNKLIFNAAGKEVSLTALDKSTGEIIWQTPSFGEKAMYVPCRLIEWKGKKQLFAATEGHIFGVDPETGNRVWSDEAWIPVPEEKKWSNAMVNTPVFYQGLLLVSLGDGHGCTLYRMADDLSSVTKVWKKKEIDFYMGGMIEIDGVVYGSTGDKSQWAALDLKTGQANYSTTWQGKGRGALIAADGMFYMFDERRGFMGLANINPKQLDVVSEFRITDGTGACFAHPSIYDGVLYVRHGSALVAYDVKK